MFEVVLARRSYFTRISSPCPLQTHPLLMKHLLSVNCAYCSWTMAFFCKVTYQLTEQLMMKVTTYVVRLTIDSLNFENYGLIPHSMWHSSLLLTLFSMNYTSTIEYHCLIWSADIKLLCCSAVELTVRAVKSGLGDRRVKEQQSMSDTLHSWKSQACARFAVMLNDEVTANTSPDRLSKNVQAS